MDQTAITAAVRRGIREPLVRTVSNTQIAAVTLRGVLVVGMEIKRVDPSFFYTRKVVTSNTHIFPYPSDCMTVLKVWDLKTNAIVITGAADNGSGLVRLTSVGHGFASNDIIPINDIVGTTEANGTWKITVITDDTFDLIGSVFANAYVSGGLAYEEPSKFYDINKVILTDATNRDKEQWYPRARNIVVDHPDFTDDIILNYDAAPDAITDIPAEYHEYLVSFGVVDLMRVPKADNKEYYDKTASLGYHRRMIARITDQINATLKASSEPENFPSEIDFDSMTI